MFSAVVALKLEVSLEVGGLDESKGAGCSMSITRFEECYESKHLEHC